MARPVATRPESSFAKTEERDLHIAVYAAFGRTQEEIGKLLSPPLSMRGVQARIGLHRRFYDSTVEFLKPLISARMSELKSSWDIKHRNRDKGYKLIEKTLDQGLQETHQVLVGKGEYAQVVDLPVEPGMLHLTAASIAIDRVEGRALGREARLSLNADDLEQHREVDGGTLDRILADIQRMNELRGGQRALPPPQESTEAIQAEIVEDDEPAN